VNDSTDSRRGRRFEYAGFDLEPERNRVVCRYRLDGREFREVISFPGGGDWSQPAVAAAARLLFLLTGVSYYKAGAPAVIDMGTTALTGTERRFLREFYLEGLGEYAYRNGLDLSDLRIEGPELVRDGPVGYTGGDGRALIPFGGGVDSIVTVELIRKRADDAALFVVNRPDDRFDAIEEPAAVTGLPVVRAERSMDEQILRSRELGFLNGHVPVTGVISAIAVLAAVLEGRDAVLGHAGGGRPVDQSSVLQERGVRGRLPRGDRREPGVRARVLLPAPADERGLDRRAVRRPAPVLRPFPQLQPGFPDRPGETVRSLVRGLRQVLLHRSGARAVRR
jgi:hypothetical protein